MNDINKTYKPRDGNLNIQMNAIVANQYARGAMDIDVTFATANSDTLLDVGFRASRWTVVGNNVGGQLKQTGVNDRYLILRASSAGDYIVRVW